MDKIEVVTSHGQLTKLALTKSLLPIALVIDQQMFLTMTET
jgi:hypothetical protein